jgi:hypothetical protein
MRETFQFGNEGSRRALDRLLCVLLTCDIQRQSSRASIRTTQGAQRIDRRVVGDTDCVASRLRWRLVMFWKNLSDIRDSARCRSFRGDHRRRGSPFGGAPAATRMAAPARHFAALQHFAAPQAHFTAPQAHFAATRPHFAAPHFVHVLPCRISRRLRSISESAQEPRTRPALALSDPSALR